jgi:hypothetical protein
MLKNRIGLSLLFSEMAEGKFIAITVFGRVAYVGIEYAQQSTRRVIVDLVSDSPYSGRRSP